MSTSSQNCHAIVCVAASGDGVDCKDLFAQAPNGVVAKSDPSRSQFAESSVKRDWLPPGPHEHHSASMCWGTLAVMRRAASQNDSRAAWPRHLRFPLFRLREVANRRRRLCTGSCIVA